MPRARSLKPAFFQNEALADCGPVAMLLYAGLWCLADREGRLEDRPRRIAAQLFPYFAVDVNAELTRLIAAGFVRRYTVARHRYLCIPTFAHHQNPHHREPPSTFPAPPQASPGLAPGQPQASPGPAPGQAVPSRADSLNRTPVTGLRTPGAGARAPARETTTVSEKTHDEKDDAAGEDALSRWTRRHRRAWEEAAGQSAAPRPRRQKDAP